jgi:hypothetical protein
MRRDVEVQNPDPVIKAREHPVRHTISGRNKYPFKGMLIGDYFKVFSETEALLVRSALQSFYSRIKGRRFSVRQRDDGEWICRRVS